MSLFKENPWETDETGDKLTNELFLGRKSKVQNVKKPTRNIIQGDKKFAVENGKKKFNIARSEENHVSIAQNKVNNKKRKSSEITMIDDSFIKKWKSESIGQAQSRQSTNVMKKEFNKKTKLHDPPTAEIEKKTIGKKAVATKLTSKKKKSEPTEKFDKVDREKPLNGTRSKAAKQVVLQNDSEPVNVMTKSRKRRLKLKEKRSNSKSNLTSQETLLTKIKKDGEKNIEHGLNAGKNRDKNLYNADNSSFNLTTDEKCKKDSKKINESRLKIDRLQRLLVNKQKNTPKNNGNHNESTSLRDRMLARLKSSRFRYLNEQMYNSESWSSKKYFKEDPDAFVAYHEGYKLQVDQWPLNPLDTIIASIKKLPKDYVVADFGCGEARLAKSVEQKVHSLDLIAINNTVTACDMAHTSLLASRIDVVVFCLSLMGTNLTDYLIEANRVLRKDGILKIAEVESRFDDVDEFIKILASYGFVNTWKDLSHNLFYFMDFKKGGDISKKRNKLPPLTLKSCLYKRR